jgi:hypothetical protein
MQVKSKIMIVALFLLWAALIIVLVTSQYLLKSKLFHRCLKEGFVNCFNSFLASMFFLFVFVSFLMGWLLFYLKVLEPAYKKLKIKKEIKHDDESIGKDQTEEF